MSLQLAAKHLASKGRGPDTTLVHMAPREVAGLQALAKAHGGSLTINPHTDLPEASFLSSILPTVIGVGLSAASGGALTPLMAGMITGAGYGLVSGNMMKGLQAGLGAWGGAGLAGGLMGAGADAAAAAGMAGADMAPQTAAQLGSGFEGQMAAQGVKPVAEAALQSAAPAGFQPLAPTASNYGAFGESPIQAGQAVQQAAPQTVTAMPELSRQEVLAAGAKQGAADFANQGVFDQMGQGIKALGTEGGRSAALSAMGGGADAMKYGLAGFGPAMMSAMQPKPAEVKGSGPNPYRYRFSWERPSGPNTISSSEAAQLRGVYTPYAEGGPVSEMSAQNNAMAMMANGGQGFAEGGDVAKGMSGASADAMRYLYGQSATSPNAQAAQARMAQLAAMSPVAAPTVDASVASGSGGTFGKFLHELGIGTPAAPSYTWNPATQTYTTVSAGPAVADAGPAYTPPVVEPQYAANGGIMALAHGGQPDLGGYSDGGRLLRGPGDGVSDSIPATIGDKRPARLADGEFVVPARIVSELGNGSTEAGARKLYSMMDRVQHARNKTVGKGKVAVNSKADKALPA